VPGGDAGELDRVGLAVNHRFARRILDAHAEWLEEAEAALTDEPGPRG
jgi:hypothetical protein